MAAADITAARLRDLLHYDPLTGVFTWRMSRGRTAKRGSVAGCISDGYVKIMADRKTYPAHRLAWIYMTGQRPKYEVDHRDTVRANNAWKNLRDIPHSANCENRKAANITSKTGFLGVSKHHRSARYRARIRVAGRLVQLGWFDTPDAAHAAYVDAKRRLHEGCTI